MKILEKIALIVYSNIMLILSIVLILVITGVLEIAIIGEMLNELLTNDSYSTVILVVSIIFTLLSIRCIFFGMKNKQEKQGILLENESGKLLISKETIENLVNSVALNFESTEEVSTKIELDAENNVRVFVNLTVNAEAIIKDLSANLQAKIIEKVKVATDLEVKEVNVSIKRVAPKKENQI